MKKIITIVILFFILSGCSLQVNNTSNEQETINQQDTNLHNNQINNSSPIDNNNLTPVQNGDTGWFVGAINETLHIHIQLNITDNKVSGVYYYDKYKKNIELYGEINNYHITLFEKASTGNIEAIFISEELIEGIWRDDKNTYPFYAIKEGSSLFIPEKPSSEDMKWKGNWRGVHGDYYSNSDLTINPIFHNLIEFDIAAISGTHLGGFSSLAIITDNNLAVYKGENDTELKFALNDDGDISLDTNNYSYYCGMGVGYDSIYTQKEISILPPTAKEVGLVYTDEQETIFKELTGEYYNTFIQYAQFYADEEDLDKMGADVRTFGMLGYTNAAIVMINQRNNTILAAIEVGDTVYYFSNNQNYTHPPKTIKDWSKDINNIISTVTDIPRQCIDYLISKNDYNENESIMFYTKEDLDLDGNNEVIIGIGTYDSFPPSISTRFTKVYILRENNGEIEQLGDNSSNLGYSVHKIKMIQLQNKPKKYLYFSYANGATYRGFHIIELKNNQPKIVYSSEGAVSGIDEIKDFDNDGKMDGYIQNRWSYDVLYYPLTRIYTLTNNGFELSETEIELPNYSMNIEGVILQYISLRTLNIEKSSEVDKRLSELCMDEKGNELDFSSEIWHSAILNTIIDFENKITFIIDENEDTAEVTIKFFDENDDNKEYERKFHLIKTGNKWRID